MFLVDLFCQELDGAVAHFFIMSVFLNLTDQIVALALQIFLEIIIFLRRLAVLTDVMFLSGYFVGCAMVGVSWTRELLGLGVHTVDKLYYYTPFICSEWQGEFADLHSFTAAAVRRKVIPIMKTSRKAKLRKTVGICRSHKTSQTSNHLCLNSRTKVMTRHKRKMKKLQRGDLSE